jgi:hypothetical protein
MNKTFRLIAEERDKKKRIKEKEKDKGDHGAIC